MVLACSERELAKEHEDGVGTQRDKLEAREHDWDKLLERLLQKEDLTPLLIL